MPEICVSRLAAPRCDASDLQRQFETSPYWWLRQVTCAVTEDRVVLHGTVPCYYLKQMAQELALKTLGRRRIDSLIHVIASETLPTE